VSAYNRCNKLLLLLFTYELLWLVQIVNVTNLKYICILFRVFKYHVFDAWRLSVWPQHVACVDGTCKICCGWQ